MNKAFRPYVGDAALNLTLDQPREREIICLVVRLQNFESLVCRMSLQNVGLLMDRYYAVTAQAVMRSQGDIHEFSGPTITAHYGVFQPVDEAMVVADAGVLFRLMCDSMEASFGAQIGLGLCRGTVLHGRFGASDRLTVTAFGSPLICADHLADEERTLGVCELLMARVSPAALPSDP